MDIPESVQVKLLTTPDVAQEIEKQWKAQSEQITIISSGQDKDPTSFHFGVMEVAAIVAIIQGVFYLGELSTQLVRWLQENKNEDNRIIIMTPLGRWEFVSRDSLTETEIKDILKSLVGVEE